MAVSDYSLTAEGVMCPVGTLTEDLPVSALPVSIEISNFVGVVSLDEDVQVGDAILVGQEIMRIEDKSSWPVIEVARGCADTIPMAHLAGTDVWFFTRDFGNDGVEYTSGDTIGVKLAPFTFSGGQVPLEYVPAHELTFDWRFARPYPPAALLANGSAWFEWEGSVGPSEDGLLLEWANRNRVEQGDQLLAHHEGSVTVEPGVTYTARVYDDTDTLVATYDGLNGSSWLYAKAVMDVDLPAGAGHIVFEAVRADLTSLFAYRIELQPASGGGFGESFGLNFGGGT